MTGPNHPAPARRQIARTAAAWLLLGLAWSPQGQAADQAAAACDAPVVTAAWPRIHVVVTGARRVAGNITLTVYGDRKAAFLAHHGSLAVTRVTLTGPGAEACLAVSAPGTYAIAVYHDENDNHHFDRNFLGLPAEGYGFSNDAPTVLGPPSFTAARISVPSAGTRISIRLRY